LATSELAKREIVGCGVVVRDDGLVMVPLPMVSTFIPDEQMKEFKIVIPSDTGDPEELDATFQGRDERYDVGFVKANAPRQWTTIHFQEAPVLVGQNVYGIGVLPKSAGYKPYLTQATVSSNLRGEIPQVLVSGGLGNIGSPVFDDQFQPIGVVFPQEGQDVLLEGERNELAGLLVPPRFFVPTRFFESGIDDPPSVGHPLAIPWIGVPGITGVNQQFAEFLGLKDQPAVQVGDVVPGAPAALAGIVPGNIIIGMNGQPLERGDLPEELPMILHRRLMRMKVGDKVTFTVLTEKGAAPRQVELTLQPRPRAPSEARRFFAQDLGFVAREAVFTDGYDHKMKPDATGVVIDVLRRDGAAASAKLAPEDWVLELNGRLVASLDQFRRDYRAFRRDHPRDDVVLVVNRASGEEETVNIEPPQSDALPGGAGGDQP
jgi:serine protease Do